MERKYAEFAATKACELLAIDSPSGYTQKAATWVKEAFEALGFAAKITTKGGVLADLGGADKDDALFLQAHTDTLGAMVFGIVIVNAARSRGVTEARLLTRYTVWAGLMAGVGLTLLYLALFRLGSDSASLVDQSANGAAILHAYVQHTFGGGGSFLLAALIFIACLVTAVGLTCACAEFFAQYVPLSYRTLVFILGGFSMVVSNLGLSQLIQISVPVLTAIYPPCIALVVLSFTRSWWHNSSRVIAPPMFISLLFGILDGIKASAFSDILPSWAQRLPLAEQGLAWLMPTVVMVVLAIIWDRAAGRQVTSSAH